MESERVDELIAGHALDALSPEDERELEQHLRRSPEARERLAALQETAAALAYGVESPPPPASLRERLLEQARLSQQPANVVPLRRRILVPALAAAAAAAAGVAIGLGVWASSLSDSLSDERAALARQGEVLALSVRPGSSRFDVEGATGTLVVAPGGRGALVLSSLNRAPDGMTYEAWVIENGQPRPAGLFEGGGSQTIVTLTRPVLEGATVAVTLEREGGVEAPTSDPILAAPTA